VKGWFISNASAMARASGDPVVTNLGRGWIRITAYDGSSLDLRMSERHFEQLAHDLLVVGEEQNR
jgi:hypothetical protein